eukprot:CAMPEP_0205857168 /NCGR_PEP_ID=MMETSP1083-20121108/3519_1 /ASSEMBLY_ACC=CAM_ASM_000430 /TAXON_ID=97485 /ORGANISM="Prymnesium parvum, Strain Texoma1" /LENGTH=133 /DNA_ID=CAMNT_0053218641 /DNA_START=215 /DNA_END=616 /DNA_ORIENTATION=+
MKPMPQLVKGSTTGRTKQYQPIATAVLRWSGPRGSTDKIGFSCNREFESRVRASLHTACALHIMTRTKRMVGTMPTPRAAASTADADQGLSKSVTGWMTSCSPKARQSSDAVHNRCNTTCHCRAMMSRLFIVV